MGTADTMTAQAEAEQLRAEISERRFALGRDLDALGDHVSPGRIVDRRRAAMSGRMRSMKDKLMGAAHDGSSTISDRASSMGSAVEDRTSSAVHAIGDAPDMARQSTQGNPLAMGLVSFGVGLVAASLLPASRGERQLARRAEPALQRAAEEAGAMARHEADELTPMAREAAIDLRDDAADAARVVAERAQSGAADVQQQVQAGAEQVADQARHGQRP